MIKPTDLRIGNLMLDKLGDIVELYSINKTFFHVDGYKRQVSVKSIKPIPLTEEWLVKFGFNKEYKEGYIGINVNFTDFVLTYPKRMGEFQDYFAFQYETGTLSRFKDIKFVHQLQNIYFALTGEELTIKQ